MRLPWEDSRCAGLVGALAGLLILAACGAAKLEALGQTAVDAAEGLYRLVDAAYGEFSTAIDNIPSRSYLEVAPDRTVESD